MFFKKKETIAYFTAILIFVCKKLHFRCSKYKCCYKTRHTVYVRVCK